MCIRDSIKGGRAGPGAAARRASGALGGEDTDDDVEKGLAAPRPFFNGGFYVRPAAFYEALELPAGSEITLFTGFHLPAKSRAKSLAYVAAVRAIFERRGFAVAEAVGGDADGDLARMVFAATFVPSGGGFSALIAGTRRALLEI